MWPYHPELLAVPVPRYTSYPTAAEFGEAVGAEAQGRALARVEGDISLYVHVPFCERICWYCGCNTGAANRRQRVSSYLDALQREVALTARALSKPARVTTVAFGGGSPNALTPVQFLGLVQDVIVRFGALDADWSIELDPRSLTPDWLPTLKGVGVRRASLGVQTFAPALQEAIGRVQPDADIARSVDLLRAAGVTSLNFDLMYGLPGQTMDDLELTLERTVALGADRIALFGYAHVPHMLPRKQRIDASRLPDAELRFAMAARGFDLLVAAGYQPVGFDHFALAADPLAQAAREGRLRRNFQGFTEDAAETVIGLGATAISCFPDLLVQNEKNPGRYRMLLSQDRLTGARGVARTADDRRRGKVIEGLLCDGRVRVDEALRRETEPALAPFIAAGLCAFADGELVLAADGLPYARSIAARFDAYRPLTERRFSSAI